MLRFVRSGRGRPQAQQGAHDDCVMALGIAWYAKDQEPLFPEELPALTVLPLQLKPVLLQRAAAPAAALSHAPGPPSPSRVRGAGVRKSSLREPPASPLGPCPPLPMAV